MIFRKDFSTIYYLLIICAAVTYLYLQTLDNPIVFDTARNFSASNLQGYVDNFHPLSLRAWPHLLFGVMYRLVGVDWFWDRVINLAFHALNSCLIFVFLRELFAACLSFKEKKKKKKIEPPVITSTWMAFVAALLFAVHPISVYATAYLIQRSMLMATCFSVLTLIFYLRGVLEERRIFLFSSVLFYFLAVHSKEHCITLPAVLFFMSYLLKPEGFKRWLVKNLWVYAIYFIIALEVLFLSRGVVGTLHETHTQLLYSYTEAGLMDTHQVHLLSVINQGWLFFRYLFLWLVPWPGWLSIDLHPYFSLKLLSWPVSFGFCLFCLWPFLSFVLIRQRGAKGLAGFGFLFAWIVFLPELTVVRMSEHFVLYRSYFMACGLLCVLPFVFLFSFKERVWMLAKVVFLFAVIVVFFIVSWGRINTFDSKISLWRDAADKVEWHDQSNLVHAARPLINLAYAWSEKEDFENALKIYRETLKSSPYHVEARNNMAHVLANLNRCDEAIVEFETILKLLPHYVEPRLGLAVCLAKGGNLDESFKHNAIALKKDPLNYRAHFNMGNLYYMIKDYEKAKTHYKKASEIDKNEPGVFYYLGMACLKAGDTEGAQRAFLRVLEIDEGNPEALKMLNTLR